jgi:hemerythrin-like metal-binding protein
MTPIEWTEALQLGYAPMDRVHKEFVTLLAQMQASDDHELAERWQALLTHTERHFRSEDEWMRKTHFAGADNHMLQHRVVLNVMREGLVMGRTGDLPPLREMASELAAWFSKHTQSQDAALALHMRSQKKWVAETH